MKLLFDERDLYCNLTIETSPLRSRWQNCCLAMKLPPLHLPLSQEEKKSVPSH